MPTMIDYSEGDIPDSIRVAIASNGGEQIDGHFGSCTHFLIYQVSIEKIGLSDIRKPVRANVTGDRNTLRVKLCQDCHIMVVQSVGGPAAARIVRAGIHPMKIPQGGNARTLLADLQRVMATKPPPWLAKILGIPVNWHRGRNKD